MLKSASFSTTECRFASRPALLFIQADLIADHCDELAVRWFSPQVMDGITEVAVEGVHITPVPCHLDGVADGALYPAGGGAVFLGDLRVAVLIRQRSLLHRKRASCIGKSMQEARYYHIMREP